MLWQREKIPEGPYQICALHKIRLYISRPDRRVHFKNAIGKFFNPHDLVHLEKDDLCRLCAEAGNYCTKFGHWEAIFLS